MEEADQYDKRMLSYLENLSQAPFIPINTYRIQINPKFPFSEATKIIPYLQELGIDAIYTSPYFQATPGSMHGYDISSPMRLNPELGSDQDYEEFCKTLTKNNMGHIADLVANHMSATEHNEWWWDVLENGKASIYNNYFDIDWNPIRQDLKNRILIPVLQESLNDAIVDGSITISLTEGLFTIHLNHRFFPMNPDSYPELLVIDPEELKKILHEDYRTINKYLAVISFFESLPNPKEKEEVDRYKRRMMVDQAKRALIEVLRQAKPLHDFLQKKIQWLNTDIHDLQRIRLLERILKQQHYQLTHWQEGPQSINYRRFFDINELAALKAEDIEVFKHFHTLLFRLIIENKIQGLRIDHPDGFYEPATFLEWLHRFYLENKLEKDFSENPPKDIDFYECKSLIWKKSFLHKTPIYVVVEKILEEHESLPEDWDIYGTVGYKFLNIHNGLFIDTTKAEDFTKIYRNFTGFDKDPEKLLYEQKRKYALVYMLSEINVLTKRLYQNAKKYEQKIPFSEEELKTGIAELFAAFPVYRTYVRGLDSSLREQDKVAITRAFEKAKESDVYVNPSVFAFLEKVFFIDEQIPGPSSTAYRDFILHFQQLSPPIMAKGFEDTFLYIYNRFASLNEVGGNPFRFGISSDEFHMQNQRRLKNWPKAFITTSTHDTKRSEDLRQRLNVLSEIPEQWQEKIQYWSSLNKKFKKEIGSLPEAPDKNTEYLLYQSLLGYWPLEEEEGNDFSNLIDRMKNYMRKASREAKVHTNWFAPHKDFENALIEFIEKIFSKEHSSEFWKDFLVFHKQISFFGVMNSFSAVIMKLGSPGVVDTYQGMEFLDFSLVDPDNRRFVDFNLRVSLLKELKQNCDTIIPELANFLSRWFFKREFKKIKMYLQWRGLNLRKFFPNLFLEGEYIPLEIQGKRKRKFVGFFRKQNREFAVFVTGRYFTDWPFEENSLFQKDFWEDTKILIPEPLIGRNAVDILSGKKILFTEDLTPGELFAFLPQSIIIPEEMREIYEKT